MSSYIVGISVVWYALSCPRPMTILNKHCMNLLQNPMYVVLIQMVFSTFHRIFLPSSSRKSIGNGRCAHNNLSYAYYRYDWFESSSTGVPCNHKEHDSVDHTLPRIVHIRQT